MREVFYNLGIHEPTFGHVLRNEDSYLVAGLLFQREFVQVWRLQEHQDQEQLEPLTNLGCHHLTFFFAFSYIFV